MSQYKIYIPCKCGKTYEVTLPRTLFPMNSKIPSHFTNHACPNCKKVWNLCPSVPLPNPARVFLAGKL